MPDRQALISVVIPVYNASRFLNEAIASARGQSYQNLEILIVDDGSADTSLAIAEEHARQDARIRIITQENAGVGAARNRALAEATGEFFAPLDADDTWAPEKLERQASFLQAKGPEWGFCYCWSNSINERGEVSTPIYHWPISGEVFHSLLYRNIVGNASVPLFRMDAVREAGGYPTRAEQGGGQGCEDWAMTLRVAANRLAGGVEEYLVGYRQITGTMSGNVEKMSLSYAAMIADLKRRDPDIPARYFRWSAGHFYLYMLNIAYIRGNYPRCFSIIAKALASDPAVFLCPTIYRVAPMSVLRSIFGKQFLQRTEKARAGSFVIDKPEWYWRPAHWIEARRWKDVRRENLGR